MQHFVKSNEATDPGLDSWEEAWYFYWTPTVHRCHMVPQSCRNSKKMLPFRHSMPSQRFHGSATKGSARIHWQRCTAGPKWSLNMIPKLRKTCLGHATYYIILYDIVLYTCRYKQKYKYMIVYVWITLDYVVFTYDISLHVHSALILRTMSLHVVKSRRISHLWNRPMDVHPLKHTSWWKNRPTTQHWLIFGKLLHNYGKIHNVQWENPLFRLGHVSFLLTFTI